MTELHPEVCPTCGRDGMQAMLCFTCDHCPRHCKCDDKREPIKPAEFDSSGGEWNE